MTFVKPKGKIVANYSSFFLSETFLSEVCREGGSLCPINNFMNGAHHVIVVFQLNSINIRTV